MPTIYGCETETYIIGGFACSPVMETYPLLNYCARLAAKPSPVIGDICEFGVAGGDSLRVIVCGRDSIDPARTHRVFGFDCFTGLPKDWKVSDALTHGTGYFSTNGCAPSVDGAILIQGLFSDTVPAFAKDHTAGVPVKFLSLDCDLYESAKTVLFALNSRIVKGTIIYFDELFDWGGGTDRYTYWQDGEYKALVEWLMKYNRSVVPLARNNRYGVAMVVG